MDIPIVPIGSLQAYYFAGNIPAISIVATNPTEIQIKVTSNSEFIVTELHEPDSGELIVLHISDLVNSHLSATWSADPFASVDHFIQNSSFATVSITVGTTPPVTFKTLRGIVDAEHNFDFSDYMKKNLLTLCPQVKYVGWNENNTVNFFFFGPGKIIQTGFFRQTVSELLPETYTDTCDLYSISQTDKLITADVNFNKLYLNPNWLLQEDKGYVVQYIEIQAQDTSSGVKTHPIRLIPEQASGPNDDLFAFENSLGGIDVIKFTGVLLTERKHEYLSHMNHKRIIEHSLIPLTSNMKNTGFFRNNDEAEFAVGFLASTKRYHLKDQSWKRIFVTDIDAKTIQGKLNSFSFGFSYSHQHTGQMLTRKTEL